MYVKTRARVGRDSFFFSAERAVLGSFACRSVIYQRFVRAKNYELNGNESIQFISPLKTILERQTAGDGTTELSFC